MTNLKINTWFAVRKAEDGVKGWEAAVVNATKAGDAAAIEFCRGSLEMAKGNLERVRRDVRENWTAYL